MDLEGKSALVTGGAKRVGREICLALAAQGANIVIHYNESAESAEETAQQVERIGRRAVCLKAELSDSSAPTRLVKESCRAFGRLNCVINNASIYFATALESCNSDVFDRFIAVNLRAPYLIGIEAGREMRRQGGGKIINISDCAVERPYKEYLPYLISKGGLVTLTKALAVELAPEVLVNAIAPGPVLLPEDMSTQASQQVIEKTLVGRSGSPQDVASAVLFLLQGSDFITGQIVVVDGG